MSRVFISYSRTDIAFARLLYQSLQETGNETWIDWQDIPPSADWLAEIYEAIESSDTVVFIISEHSLQSEICSREVAHAAENGKRLIPIVLPGVDPQSIPPQLAALNWIFFPSDNTPDPEPFQAAFQQLITAVQTDLDWTRAHTRLQVRALEWDRKQRDRAFLLRGRDLEEAEAWLGQTNSQQATHPTALHQQFILASRKDALRRQRLTTGAVLTALVITILLAVFAWVQRNASIRSMEQAQISEATARSAESTAIAENLLRATAQAEAEAQSQVSLAHSLGSQSLLLLEDRANLLPTSVLLALESLKRAATLEGDQAIRESMALLPRQEAVLQVQTEKYAKDVEGLAFHPDGSLLAVGILGSEIHIFDTATWQTVRTIQLDPAEYGVVPQIRMAAYSPDGSLLAAGTDAGVFVWDQQGTLLPKVVEGQTFSLAFSPDGRWIAAGNRLWNPVTGEIHRELPFFAMNLRFSSDGSLLVITDETRIHAIRVESGETAWEHTQVEQGDASDFSSIRSLAISPDAKWVAAGEGGSRGGWLEPRQPVGGRIVVYDATNGETAAEFTHLDEVRGLEFTPDGSSLISASYDTTLAFWDMKSKTRLDTLNYTQPVNEISLANGGQWLVAGATDGSARIYDLASRQEISRLASEETGIFTALAADFSSGRVAAGNDAGGVWIWQAFPPPYQHLEYPTTHYIYTNAFSPDGSLLLAASGDGTARTWEVETLTEVSQQEFPKEKVLAAVFSPTGNLAAAGSMAGKVQVWDASTNEVLLDTSLSAGMAGLTFSPDGSLLAAWTGTEPRNGWFIGSGGSPLDSPTPYEVVLWNMPGMDVQLRIPMTRAINSLDFDSTSRYILFGGSEGEAHIWDARAGRRILTVSHGERINHVRLSPDGKSFVTAGSCFKPTFGSGNPTCEPAVKAWSTADGSLLWEVHLQGYWIETIQFSPDGKTILVGNSSIQGCLPWNCGAVHVFNTGDGVETMVIRDSGYILDLAFSPDGSTLAMGTTEALRLFDAIQMDEIGRISHPGEAWDLSYSPDGKLLAASGWTPQTGILLHPASGQELMAEACNRLTRNLTPAEWRQYLGSEPYAATCPDLQVPATNLP